MAILEFKEGHNKYIMDSFEFEYGRVLENVQVEYSLYGTPKYDEKGNITNAVLYCHGFNGNYTSLNDLYQLTKPGAEFSRENYFLISITSLGFPESCSPSTTGLKQNFPRYSIRDRVNFKRQFLAEKLGIHKLYGITGRGLGGYEAYTWACEYPDEMDFIIVLSSSYKTNGYRYVVSKCIDSIIDSSDDLYQEYYSESISRIMVSLNQLAYSNYFSKKAFQEMSNDEIDALMDDFVDRGLFTDIHDFKFRNDAILYYDLTDKLSNIKAKALIISSKDDIYYSPEFDTIPLTDFISDSKVVLYESNVDINGFEDYSFLESYLKEFMKDFKK